MITVNDTTARSILEFINGRMYLGSVNPTPKIVIYGGSRPSNPSQSPTSPKLVEFNIPANIFPQIYSEAEYVYANATPDLIPQSKVLTSGTATWFRMLDRNGQALFDGSVSGPEEDGDLKLEIISLLIDRNVFVNSWNTRFPK